MMDKLEQLRAKPPHIKRMIAAGTAGTITLVIVIFWIVSLSITSADGSSGMADSASAQIAASPFSTLSASVSDAFAPVAAAFESLINSFSGTPSTSSNVIQIYSANQQYQNGSSAEMNTMSSSHNQ